VTLEIERGLGRGERRRNNEPEKSHRELPAPWCPNHQQGHKRRGPQGEKATPKGKESLGGERERTAGQIEAKDPGLLRTGVCNGESAHWESG